MYFKFKGKVAHGDGYGRKLGFPTINLETDATDFPAMGVYAGSARIECVVYRAGIVIGPNNKIEAHLIGYSGDLYGREVSLTLEKFLREYKKFDTEEELIAQIKEDIKQC